MSLVRELGPVLTALMIGGRVGAGITAELGSMAVTDQIDAVRALGASPVRNLVVPRLAAILVMLPVLTIIGDLVGVLGGLVLSVTELNVSADFYLNSLRQVLLLGDVFSGRVIRTVRGATVRGIQVTKSLFQKAEQRCLELWC